MKNPGPQYIAGFKEGSVEAFHNIFRKYYRPLYFFVKQLLNDPHEAEDIVSESFLKLWKMRANFETEQNIKAFLYITCRNASLNCLNYRKRITSHHKEILYSLSEEENLSHQGSYADILQLLEIAIEKLPEKQQEVMKMILFEGLTDEEIGERLNKTEKTVRNQKNTAIQLLRINLDNKKMITTILISLILLAE